VEDDEDLSRILGFYVRKSLGEEVSLRRAADGVEAIARVRERSPNLMLLDIHMPRMNGIEVAMQIRGERLAPHCKVIGLSAGAQEHDLQLLHQLGMHHFVPKDERLRQRLDLALRALFG
ncbi:MAG: response regulator, partial [Myxococcota bacterium]